MHCALSGGGAVGMALLLVDSGHVHYCYTQQEPVKQARPSCRLAEIGSRPLGTPGGEEVHCLHQQAERQGRPSSPGHGFSALHTRITNSKAIYTPGHVDSYGKITAAGKGLIPPSSALCRVSTVPYARTLLLGLHLTSSVSQKQTARGLCFRPCPPGHSHLFEEPGKAGVA